MIAATHLYAQTDTRLFNHLSVGLNVGTTGIGADIAMPATRFLDIEAGISIMPKIKYNTNLHLNLSTSAINPILPTPIDLDDIPAQGKLKMINGKLMINFYPIAVSSFHNLSGKYIY